MDLEWLKLWEILRGVFSFEDGAFDPSHQMLASSADSTLYSLQ